MEASLRRHGELDQCLFRLAKAGIIEQEEALRAADSRDGLALKFRSSEGSSGEHDPYADFSAGAPSITTASDRTKKTDQVVCTRAT